ncbi:MAG: imidazole glycerol phosphate synthase subunit HisH [Burkholderiales bacterium]
MKVVVIDYGMGNLRSVSKALEHVAPNAQIIVTSDAKTVLSADRVVFPGQGAMPDCMREVEARNLRPAILATARDRPFLGICIGLQMLFEESEEGQTKGLGLFPGNVQRFQRNEIDAGGNAHLKIPHMGWNRVGQIGSHDMWSGIEDSARFYFVHSYYANPALKSLIAGQTNYGINFTCAVARDNIFAVQFHPEKSQSSGLRLLANFIDWNP